MPSDRDPVIDARELVLELFPGARWALLTGSVLTEHRTGGSDLDIVVVLPDGDPLAPHRSSRHHRGWPVELFVHDEATLASRGIEPGTLPAVHDEATLVSRGIEPGTLPAIHDEATLTARGIQPADPIVVADTGSGFDMPSVEPGTVAALAGGAAAVGLLIAGAAFATRRREPGTV